MPAFSGGAWHPDSPRVGVPGILTGSAFDDGPRSAEVPFLTLFDFLLFKSERYLGQTMLKVAPLGKRVWVRATFSGGDVTTGWPWQPSRNVILSEGAERVSRRIYVSEALSETSVLRTCLASSREAR
jgi:hypothetical protein